MKLPYELRVTKRDVPEQSIKAGVSIFRSRTRAALEKQAALWARSPAYVSHEIVTRVTDLPATPR